MLPGYDIVGVGRDDGATEGEYAAIFYRTGKYTLLDSGTFWLSETPYLPSLGWDANNVRICTYASFQHIETGEVFSHYNTHLDHKGEQARNNGLALILQRMSENMNPALLTGDLNVFEGSELYSRVLEAGFVDAKVEADTTMSHGTINWFQPINSGLVIDFVFLESDHFTTQSYRVATSAEFDGTPVSDHYPVIVDATLLDSTP